MQGSNRIIHSGHICPFREELMETYHYMEHFWSFFLFLSKNIKIILFLGKKIWPGKNGGGGIKEGVLARIYTIDIKSKFFSGVSH